MSTEPQRRLEPLSRDEAMALLASAPLGRVVFTDRALPTIRPVNHLVDGEDVIVRSHLGSAVTAAVAGQSGVVVAYEADDIDTVLRQGWSVVVTGTARLVVEPEAVARYEQLLRPWIAQPMTSVIRISTDLVNGFRLVDDGHPANGHPPAGEAEITATIQGTIALSGS